MTNTVRDTRPAWVACALLLLAFAAAPTARAHTPVVDGFLTDWCVGAASNSAPAGGRTEDSAVNLSCGNCSITTDQACVVASDCPAGEACNNPNSRMEVAFWDNRWDGAVNDLGTVAMTWDNTNLYISAELWVDPDPVSLPFGQIAIDVVQGGVNRWHDPENKMVNPGRCSVSADRGCTSNDDCHFCAVSTEPTGGRKRTCGSGCDPLDPMDVCDMTQTCQNLGSLGVLQTVGGDASPDSDPDFLILFDFSFWLLGAEDAVLLARPTATGSPLEWFNVLGINIAGWGATSWDPVTGCAPDFAGDGTECDFAPQVNPGASGGSGGPPGSVEVAIPWTAFGGAMGPDIPFRFTMSISRGTSSLNFSPDGAHEDILSEPVAGATTTTLDSCPGLGTVTTDCELLGDGSTDAFLPLMPPLNHEDMPGGRNTGLLGTKNQNGTITLDWVGSCSAGDTDYEVYEGTIGNWTDHIPVVGFCSTGGLTTATFTPGAADHYYLVVPADGVNEGSYGIDSAGVERPVSMMQCAPQSLGNCP